MEQVVQRPLVLYRVGAFNRFHEPPGPGRARGRPGPGYDEQVRAPREYLRTAPASRRAASRQGMDRPPGRRWSDIEFAQVEVFTQAPEGAAGSLRGRGIRRKVLDGCKRAM